MLGAIVGDTVDMKKLDENFEEAVRVVVSTGRASTTYLQTSLGMGYARSARVMSQLEAPALLDRRWGNRRTGKYWSLRLMS